MHQVFLDLAVLRRSALQPVGVVGVQAAVKPALRNG
jgi:hypothetical protein